MERRLFLVRMISSASTSVDRRHEQTRQRPQTGNHERDPSRYSGRSFRGARAEGGGLCMRAGRSRTTVVNSGEIVVIAHRLCGPIPGGSGTVSQEAGTEV